VNLAASLLAATLLAGACDPPRLSPPAARNEDAAVAAKETGEASAPPAVAATRDVQQPQGEPAKPADPNAPDPKQRVKPVWPSGKEPPAGDAPAKPEERWLQCEQYDIDWGGKNFRTLRIGKPGWPEVLLLHGMKFDCRTWLDLGTLELLAKEGFRAVAIDLPGYGRSKDLAAKPDEFLFAALPRLDLKKPVILFPSMSGIFAFPFAVAHPEMITGLVPIAPVGITDWGAKLSGSPLPALIVWGEADTVIPLAQAETLHQLLPKSEKLILPKASHPCYLDDPATFHAGLLEFLKPFKPEGPIPAGRQPR
jgi:abhydrolase domain-containing protein 14